jgi:hypothetical protein
LSGGSRFALYSPDGALLLVSKGEAGNDGFTVYDTVSGDVVFGAAPRHYGLGALPVTLFYLGSQYVATAGRLHIAVTITVWNSLTGQVLTSACPHARTSALDVDRPGANISRTSWSPLGSFLVTFERLTPEKDANLIVWNVREGIMQAGFKQKQVSSDAWPIFKWSSDEKVVGRLVSNEVQFLDGKELGPPVSRLRLKNIKAFQLGTTPEGQVKVAGAVRVSGTIGGISGVRYFSTLPVRVTLCF